ncbi:hypothetical protein [Helcobacillus massiliensis]|uniref:DNA-binding protein n=1 Tax=Helcobacillus massiliensis TaxID=521392 RepID=A0A839QVN5_9MICO|nr:hypothetical protein [Helcobacillus massiliensis]MBB3022840.1 hypothetical protein [Helcobacillus massiliensis]
MYTMRELSENGLGCTDHLRDLIRARGIPMYRIGRRLAIRERDLCLLVEALPSTPSGGAA